MQIIKPAAVPAQPATSPLFTGEVSRQPILTPEMSQHFNLGIVNFPAGVRNKMHTHSSDQVLFVTAGTGIIATETEEKEITVGDIVHIPTVSPLMIPLVYCHINKFQRASSMEKPCPGGEKRRDGQAAHPVA